MSKLQELYEARLLEGCNYAIGAGFPHRFFEIG